MRATPSKKRKDASVPVMQKLRRKFILINMLLVAAVLLIAFAVLCAATWRRQEEDGREALRRALDRAGHSPPKTEMGAKPPEGTLSAAPTVCVTVSPDGGILSVSDSGASLAEDVLAQAVSETLASGKEEGVLSGLGLRFMVRQTPEGTKIAFADRSGEIRAMAQLIGTSLLVGVGGLAAFFVISLFLSGWALRPVRRAWEQQRQFVADASHELKTPLTVVLANTEILQTHPQDTIASQRKWVDYIGAEARRMKGLVDDLLFLAKSDAARGAAFSASLNFSDTVLNGLLPFEPVAFERGLDLHSDVAPGLLVAGDEGQLGQLVRILLDNACKYAAPAGGRKGSITLTLEREGERACLRVANTGPILPPDQLAHIFERFYRADASRARRGGADEEEQGGYGLGLSIAQSIVERHRGRITAESTPGKGTVFTVWIPCKTV